MNKVFKRLLSIILPVITVFTFFSVGCATNVNGVTEKIDETKTQLYIGNYNGGYGDAWLKALKKRFEEFYATTSFEAGKKGVQVLIDNKKEEYKSIDTLASQIGSSKNSIYFTEGLSYDQLIARGYVLDISDALSTPLSEYGDDSTIYSKFTQQQKDYYIVSNKCYAIPTYSAYFGIIYDIDLFEKELLYFAKDADNGNDGFIFSLNDERSYGPDGKTGVIDGVDYSLDDGLPATYADFYKLCTRMDDSGITPFIWSGQYCSSYMRQLASALLVDYEGYDDASLNFTYTGSDDEIYLGNKNANGTPIFEAATIDLANGYKILGQAGRYYSIDFIRNIVANDWYVKNACFTLTESHTLAQEDYLFSSFENKPIGMLSDGIWWQTEAVDTFTSVAQVYGNQASMANRRFGFMPYPKVTESKVGEGITLYDALGAKCFVNSNVSDISKDLAIKFIRFANTEESLREFHRITNTPKSLTYTLTEEDQESLTYFGKMVAQIKNNQNTNIVYAFDDNYFYRNTGFDLLEGYVTRINGLPYSDVAKTFKDHKQFTSEQYFYGILEEYNANNWAGSNYSK